MLSFDQKLKKGFRTKKKNYAFYRFVCVWAGVYTRIQSLPVSSSSAGVINACLVLGFNVGIRDLNLGLHLRVVRALLTKLFPSNFYGFHKEYLSSLV